jgi:hypothetical protein
MSINFTDVQDTIYALISVTGIAVVFALALIAASGLSRRGQKHGTRTGTPATVTMAQQPTQTDDLRELVLR